MRWTRTFIPTLRDDPAEAETISQRLMMRAGLIRKLTSGVYSYLPLGFTVLNKVINVVREEMNRAGAQEILMPVLQPSELWQETGRLDAFGDLMCKFKDRFGRVNILGPTHEEVVTNIVRNEINSYRQLPFTLYQIQVKFRDEIRPRFGVIRSREFLMKDAYSFDVDAAGMGKSYDAMYDAYCRIFSRCGLKYTAVEADTGLIGGDVSHEFMVPSPSGEDQMVKCEKCGYAANKEKAECVVVEQRTDERHLPIKDVATPNCITVDDVAKCLKVKPSLILKTLIYKADKEYLAVLVRGDIEVNINKLVRATGLPHLELADGKDVEKVTGAPFGSCGPVGLKVKNIADNSVKDMVNFIVGANKRDYHTINVNLGRDFDADIFADIRYAVAGDPCPKCGSPIEFSNGIEVGHVFKLGTKYSEKMKALYQDESGATHPMQMGCYGIGVNRIIAAAIENSNDENGIIWPPEIAPYKAVIVSINPKDKKVADTSENIHNILVDAGIETLWDDRDLTAGVKFKDADLVGIPIRLTIGAKTLENGTVDIKLRNRKEQKSVKISSILEEVEKIKNQK
ncbi:MAG: proline--tRNA ligase [Planctomycetes bacterium RBG_16_43_13]|nr:MAG: proline--tRNA ligase [Planctomycetes bacterium RBG_16_43_13]